MQDLSDAELKHGFQFPEIYKQLLKDCMFDYDGKRDTLLDYKFYGVDLEVLSFSTAIKYYDDYLYDKDKTKKIFPFAVTGGGDWYGFYFGECKNDDGNYPIVMMCHDSDEAMFYADNLEGFIFYFLLRAGCEVDTKVSEEFYINELNRVLKTHEKYIEAEQVELLKEVYSREIKDQSDIELASSYRYRGLLTYKEAGELFVKQTGFKMFDKTFFCGLDNCAEKTREDLEIDISISSLRSSFYHPSLLLNEKNLSLDLALKIFYKYDGVAFLLDKYVETDPKNIAFMNELYQNIIDGRYENTAHQYILPITKIEKFKIIKIGRDSVFCTDL